jgi:hypothetical protein
VPTPPSMFRLDAPGRAVSPLWRERYAILPIEGSGVTADWFHVQATDAVSAGPPPCRPQMGADGESG